MMISCTFCILFFVHLGSRYIKLHLASFLHQCLSVFETSSAHSSGLLRTTVWVLQHMETSLPCLLTSHVFPKWETQSSEFQSSSPRISKGPVAHTSTERGKSSTVQMLHMWSSNPTFFLTSTAHTDWPFNHCMWAFIKGCSFPCTGHCFPDLWGSNTVVARALREPLAQAEDVRTLLPCAGRSRAWW
jgi:hypothetical protein